MENKIITNELVDLTSELEVELLRLNASLSLHDTLRTAIDLVHKLQDVVFKQQQKVTEASARNE